MPRPDLKAEHLVDRVTSLKPGIYTADSNTDAYGSLMAAVALGANLLGEHYLEDGSVSVAVRVGETVAMNPPDPFAEGGAGYFKIGPEFYAKALVDYRPDWRPMWWREAIQNSVDAGRRHLPNGITKINLEVAPTRDGNFMVSCTDNGGGMTWEIFNKKFLELGETGKGNAYRYDYMAEVERSRATTEEDEPGDAGGFGEAKRLLVLPWLEVEIHSQDWIAKTRPSSGAPFVPETAPFRLDGVRLSVTMPSTNYCDVEHALRVIKRSFLPNVRFKVNGKSYLADLPLGVEQKDFAVASRGKGLLYYSKASKKLVEKKKVDEKEADAIDGKKERVPGELIVRKRGIWMFSKAVNSKISGYTILRLVAPSVDVLTGSRMTIGDYHLDKALDAKIEQMAVDPRSAMAIEANKVWKPYRGSLGAVTGSSNHENARLEAMLRQQVGAASRIDDRQNVTFIKSFLEQVAARAKAAHEEAKSAGQRDDLAKEHEGEIDETKEAKEEDDGEATGAAPVMTRSPDLAELYAEAAAKRGAAGMTAMIEVIQGIPDTTISSEVSNFYRDPKTREILTGERYKERYRTDPNGDIDEEPDPPIRRLWHPPKKFDPKHLTPTLRKLLAFWTEVLGYIMVSLGEGRQFGVGWIFKFDKRGEYPNEEVSGALAQCATRGGRTWLLLNPYRGGDIQVAETYSLRNDDDLKLIYSCAVHEATHFHNGTGGHDEDFAIALTKNMAICAMSLTQLRAVRDAVVKRPADWKPKPKAAPKPKKIKFDDELEKQVSAMIKNLAKHHYSSERFADRVGGASTRRYTMDMKTVRDENGVPVMKEGTYEYLKRVVVGVDGISVEETEPGTEAEAAAAGGLLLRKLLAEKAPSRVAEAKAKVSKGSVVDDVRAQLQQSLLDSGDSAVAHYAKPGAKLRDVVLTFRGDASEGGRWSATIDEQGYDGVALFDTSLYDMPMHFADTGNTTPESIAPVMKEAMRKLGPIIEEDLES